MAEVCVLVSVGRHPVSGRARRADLDARAVELGLGLAGPALRVVHAGDPAEPVLRDYLGMGVAALTVLPLGRDDDPLPSLVAHLRAHPVDILLAGQGAEAGEGSGLVPYLVAEALGRPLVAGAAGLELHGGRVRALQALPGGRRRAFSAALPVVVTVGAAAPEPRAVAYARARRGRIVLGPSVASADEVRRSWHVAPARRRPKRLKAVAGGNAEERLAAATRMATGAGRVLVNPGPADAARAIWDYLVAEGIVAEIPESELAPWAAYFHGWP